MTSPMTRVSSLVSKNIGNYLTNVKTWGGVMYNVLENGLVGDGVTDDTVALQTLINTAISAGRRTIFFPHTETGGEYYVTSLTNADQVDFVGDNCTFVGGYTGEIANFGGIAALQADVTQRAINVLHPPSPLVAAVGDMVNDDTAAIQAAINAVRDAGGGEVLLPLPPSAYKLTAKLSLYSNVTLQGAGRGVIIDGTGLGSTLASQKTFIEAAGSVGSSLLLSANAAEGDATVTLASVTGLAVGDWVLLGSSGTIPYTASYEANKGEIKKIRIIAGTTLTFEDNLFDSYTTANSAFVQKITFVENVAVRDLTIRGTDSPNGETAIRLTYCSNSLVDNVNIKYADIYQILVDSCIYSKITKNDMEGTYYDGVTGTNFYGVCVLNCSQWTSVIGNSSNELRHLFVCSSNSVGNNRYGQPLFINVIGNNAHNCNDSYAFNHHGFGRFVNIDSNTANKCYAGASIEGSDTSVSNNKFYDCSNYGVLVFTGRNVKNINIHDNQIKRCKGPLIAIIGESGFTYDKIKIHDNTGEIAVNTVNGIQVNSFASNVSIKNNEIFGNGGALGFGISNSAPKAKIGGNTIDNFAAGINNSGANARIIDNTVSNTTSTHAITTTAKSIISENTIDTTVGTAQGVSLGAGSTGSQVNGNTFSSVGGFVIGVNNAVNDCVIMGNYWKGAAFGLSIGTGTGHIYQTAAGDKYNRD